jgi:tetratricopeptide (TPR) repeat protein
MNPQTPVSKRRLWLMRLFAMIFVPLALLGGLELGLRLCGYGYDTHFFRQIRVNGESYYVPNEKFSYRFFPPSIARTALPIRFAAEKSTNSYRIFLFGESAANGDPDNTYGVGRYLQVLLRERYPGTDFQVICVALTAVDSSTILPIARECARHQGDLWLIYMGNNEMVGPFGAIKMVPFAANFANRNQTPPPFGATTAYGIPAPSLGVIRTVLAIKTTRIGQLLDNVIRRLKSNSSTPKEWGGMEMFANGRIGYDDSARLRAYDNFKGNLEDMLRAAHQADVPVILSTVAVNLKDCAPFASIHAAGLTTNQEAAWNAIYKTGVDLETAGSNREALVFYKKAAEIDPKFADLQFRMGECELAFTNDSQARQDFELARDYDALDFRSDTRINAAIQDAASHHAGQDVALLDAAKILAQNSPAGIPGLEFFYEHVHLNFAGNYLLALNFAEQAKNFLPVSVTAHDRGNWASAEECNDRLAVTVWDRQRVWEPIMTRVTSAPFTGQFNHDAMLKVYAAKLEEAKSRMNSQTPEQARQMYEQALALAPDDYFLHGNFQRFLEKGGYLPQAIVEAKRCCELVPQLPGGFYYTGTLLVRAGNTTEAADYFSRSLAIKPDYAEALDAMGMLLANQQKSVEAAGWFKRAIRANPDYVDSYVNLGFLQQNQGDNAAALASYQQAANLEPEGPADYFSRANLAASLFRWDEAIIDLQAVVKTKPEFWQARYQLGVQLAAKGEIENAGKQFSAVIYYRPDFFPAHLDLGTALATQSKFELAMAQFRAVLQLDPANASAKQQMAALEAKSHPDH